MRTIAYVGAVVVLGAVTARAEMKIASQGRAACVILTQPGATPAERHAAAELANDLQQITSATFEIKEAADDAPASAIIIGPGPLAQKFFTEVKLASFGGEQLTMRVKGGRMLLAGGRPCGTLYAVCRFIQEQCGVRWSPFAAHVPKNPNLSFADLTVDETPAFESRYPYWYSAFDGDWAVRNGSNGKEARLDEARGGKISYAIDKLNGQKIGITHFPKQKKAYTWYRFAAFSCFNPNGTDVPDSARPAGFALGQVEFFGKTAGVTAAK